jgi:serine/threonine protein kinase
VIYDEPDPPRRLRPSVPPDLEAVCLKCLEKDPNRRYGSAAELAADLGRYLAGQPVVAVPVSDRDRLARLALRDGYEIVGEIGRGPRSIVYHALQQAVRQPVALKVFAAGVCTPEQWEAQLRRNASLQAMLAHPQLVSVQRTGWWDGAPYVVVEYIPQGSLATKIAAQAFSLAQAIQLVEQLAEVVSYVHRQGHVHGNLKPSNVLLAADGIPRLVDFQPTGGFFQKSQHTDDPDPAGLGYLAPELASATHAEPRFYTDIYGLGIILYELLTGRPPFIATTTAAILEQVRSQEPAPPSQFNSKVSSHLDGLCCRCLRKNPWRRFSRAHDVYTGLRHLREGLERK